MGNEWAVKNLPVLSMIGLQFVYAGMSLATKYTLDSGFSPIIFLVYRQGSASLLLAPVSIMALRRRSSEQLALGKKGFFLIFMAALIGATMNMSFYYKGLELSSATLASTISNIIPALTFLMAATVGMEKVEIGSVRSMAKVVGTMICVSGAFMMALLKGKKLLNSSSRNSDYFMIWTSFLEATGDRNWLMGFFFLLGSSTCWSTWLILQVPICKNHLDPLSLSTWMSVLSTLQGAVLALILEPEWKAWRIESTLSLLFCLYTGLGSAISYFVQSWCISIRGPLFSAMFSPLCTLITSFFASILLNEELYAGSLAGAAAIIGGLYIVLWGKASDIYVGKENSEVDVIKIAVSEHKTLKIAENNLEEPLIISLNEQC